LNFPLFYFVCKIAEGTPRRHLPPCSAFIHFYHSLFIKFVNYKNNFIYIFIDMHNFLTGFLLLFRSQIDTGFLYFQKFAASVR